MRCMYPLQILDELRNSKSKLSLESLLMADFEGKIPNNTGASIFGSSIIDLVELELVQIHDKSGIDCTNALLLEASNPDCEGTIHGYEFANNLRGKEAEIYLSLTQKLEKLQQVTGFSVSRQIDYECSKSVEGTLLVSPFFGKPTGQPSSNVFVIMPFNQQNNEVYQDFIKGVCEKRGLGCCRSDDTLSSTNIINDIWELINNSELIIADCTGKNPNVFYELGIAHTLGKKVLMVTTDIEDIPFDIRHLRLLKYKFTPRGMDKFKEDLSATLDLAFNPNTKNRNFNRQPFKWHDK